MTSKIFGWSDAFAPAGVARTRVDRCRAAARCGQLRHVSGARSSAWPDQHPFHAARESTLSGGMTAKEDLMARSLICSSLALRPLRGPDDDPSSEADAQSG